MTSKSRLDHQSAHEHLSADPVLGPVVNRNGVMRLEPADDLFARLCRSVVRQQISMTAADAIFDRLESAVMLTPEEIQAATVETFLDIGLSRSKAQTLDALAMEWRDNGWTQDYFSSLDNPAVIETLTAIRGVGPWTAKMALMFGLGRPDVWPIEDLGIRRGMESLFDDELDRANMIGRAEGWRPYRSVAALHIWEFSDE